MTDVLNKTTLEYRQSVNTPDYPETGWIHEPDMSGVDGVPEKYWKLVGDAPVEMTQAEKDAVDAALAQAQLDTEIAELDAGILRRFVLVLMDEINILRANDGLQPRTIEQLKTAMRNK